MLPYLRIIKILNVNITSDFTVLDFGCGNGKMVKELIDAGLDAKGADIKFKEGPFVKQFTDKGIIHTISTGPYKIPFSDNSFDLVVSNQVLEHVQNYDESFAEIYRILKKDGLSIHSFPSKYRVFEAHVLVPFSSIIRSKAWITLWVALGFRKKISEAPAN